MNMAIETRGLTKFYGDARGIVDLDLSVHQGEVFGFLGPNGAGKSTTIRLLLSFLKPTRGSALVLGLDSERDSVAIRRKCGVLPGDLALYDNMTGRECLIYFGNLRQVDVAKRMKALAARLDLDLDRRIRDLSTGNRQKVGLVNAFMHDPELLILDEPTSGLDPLLQQEFLAIVREASDAGRTVFLSSHILPEVDRITDRVAIVRDGTLVAVDTVEAFKAKAHKTVTIQFRSPVAPDSFEALEPVVSVESRNEDTVLAIRTVGSIDAVIKLAAGSEVVSISATEGALEEAFLTYYSEASEHADSSGSGMAPSHDPEH